MRLVIEETRELYVGIIAVTWIYSPTRRDDEAHNFPIYGNLIVTRYWHGNKNALNMVRA